MRKTATTHKSELPFVIINNDNKYKRVNPAWLKLKCDFNDDIWILERDIKINWGLQMPDDRKFTDEHHRELLNSCKELLAVIRDTPYSRTASPKVMFDVANKLKRIAQWMIYNDIDRFSFLTKSHIEDFFYKLSKGTIHLIDYTSMLSSVCDSIINKNIECPVTHTGLISTKGIGNIIGITSPHFFNCINNVDKIIINLSKKTGIPLPSRSRNKQRIKTLGYNSATYYLDIFYDLYEYREELSDSISFDPKDYSDLSAFNRVKLRTPTLTEKSGLEILNTSLEWVTQHGEKLIEMRETLLTMKYQHNKALVNKLKEISPKDNDPKTPWPIHRLLYKDEGMGFYDAIYYSLWSSCLIVITTFTASRVKEVLSLKRGCVHKNNGEYFINLTITKFSGSATGDEVLKPVPEVVHKAVLILEKICCEPGNENLDDYIFSCPSGITSSKYKLRQSYTEAIDRFTSYLNLSVVTNYKYVLREHQLRRFFAMAYFWHYEYPDLKALSHHLRHSNSEATLTYITEELGGSALSEHQQNITYRILTKALHNKATGAFSNHFKKATEKIAKKIKIKVFTPERLSKWVISYTEKQEISLRPSTWGYCVWSNKRKHLAKCKDQNTGLPVPHERKESNCFICPNFITDINFSDHYHSQCILHKEVLECKNAPDILKQVAKKGLLMNKRILKDLASLNDDNT